MNDTHPTLCIPELMRIFMDLKGMTWKEAWQITQRTIAYTNHTVLPEALEKWSLKLMQKLLPRHLWPKKFQNRTNGVTLRRWVHFCNPDLSNIITKWIGTEDRIRDTNKFAELRKSKENLPQFADNEDLQKEWRAAKRSKKIRWYHSSRKKRGHSIGPNAMFDIQVKPYP
ncbi:hypothetical protein LguiA_004923 [Lonicera macranthoides]